MAALITLVLAALMVAALFGSVGATVYIMRRVECPPRPRLLVDPAFWFAFFVTLAGTGHVLKVIFK